MGKVIFEFDEIEDNKDIKNIINRNKLIYALEELDRCLNSVKSLLDY